MWGVGECRDEGESSEDCLFGWFICLRQDLSVKPWLAWNELYRAGWDRICDDPPASVA